MKIESISSQHKNYKKESYWNNLVHGGTAAYKEQIIDELLKIHVSPQCKTILDIGCGTCDVALRYRDVYQATNVTCMDYDSKVIESLKNKYRDQGINWLVGDVFSLRDHSSKFDLIFLLDMIHEVYSFYGRPDGKMGSPIDHDFGLLKIRDLLQNVMVVTSKGGCIVITDNVLTEKTNSVFIRFKNSNSSAASRHFLENYPTKKLKYRLLENDLLEIHARDFCILLTQYNKIKSKNWDRWNIERLETHQYFTQRQYADFFLENGFEPIIVTGTPTDALEEWEQDFELVSGLDQFPEKRITLIAKNLGFSNSSL